MDKVDGATATPVHFLLGLMENNANLSFMKVTKKTHGVIQLKKKKNYWKKDMKWLAFPSDSTEQTACYGSIWMKNQQLFGNSGLQDSGRRHVVRSS